jgi:hypothetical protein
MGCMGKFTHPKWYKNFCTCDKEVLSVRGFKRVARHSEFFI